MTAHVEQFITSESKQVALPAPPDTLSLTIEDLDRGLSPEQSEWLYSHFNVRGFLKDLARIAPAADADAPPLETSVDDDTR